MLACKRRLPALPVLTYRSTLRAGSRQAPFSAQPEPNLDTSGAPSIIPTKVGMQDCMRLNVGSYRQRPPILDSGFRRNDGR